MERDYSGGRGWGEGKIQVMDGFHGRRAAASLIFDKGLQKPHE